MLLEFIGQLFDRYIFWRMGKRRFSRKTPPEMHERLLELDPTIRLSDAVGTSDGLEPGIGGLESIPGVSRQCRRWRCPSPKGNGEMAGLLFGEPKAERGLLYVHGWMQPDYTGFAELAAYHEARGAAVWCLELPHHLTRTPPGEYSGASFICGDVSETLDSFVQGLNEVTAIVALLRRDYREALTLGHSLGGLLTGLHACLSTAPQHRAALLTPAVDPLSILSDSVLTVNVRQDVLGQGLPLDVLRKLLEPVNLLKRRPKTDPTNILLVAARTDQVIPLPLQHRLRDAWGCRYYEARTGHLGVLLPLGLFRRPVGLWRRIVDHLCPQTS